MRERERILTGRRGRRENRRKEERKTENEMREREGEY
jgi:hypothetical protein